MHGAVAIVVEEEAIRIVTIADPTNPQPPLGRAFDANNHVADANLIVVLGAGPDIDDRRSQREIEQGPGRDRRRSPQSAPSTAKKREEAKSISWQRWLRFTIRFGIIQWMWKVDVRATPSITIWAKNKRSLMPAGHPMYNIEARHRESIA
jgi:hypothetical protein